MTIVCNIWMICFKLNWFVYDPSWMLHLSEFVWTLRSSVLVVFNNFLLIDATDRSKISSDQKRFFIALSLYPFHFSRTLPLKRFSNRSVFGQSPWASLLLRVNRPFCLFEKGKKRRPLFHWTMSCLLIITIILMWIYTGTNGVAWISVQKILCHVDP